MKAEEPKLLRVSRAAHELGFHPLTVRLLDVSREAIHLTVAALWDRLDEFATRTNPYAYKQVEEMISPPLLPGYREMNKC